MNIPSTASDMLRQLAATPDAPEPPRLTSSSWQTDGYTPPADFNPYYDTPLPDHPQAEAIRRITAALREAERERQAAREAKIRALIRDHLLLKKMLAEPTPDERPPIKECEPGKPLRWLWSDSLLGGV